MDSKVFRVHFSHKVYIFELSLSVVFKFVLTRWRNLSALRSLFSKIPVFIIFNNILGPRIWVSDFNIYHGFICTFLVLVYQGLNKMKASRKAIKDSDNGNYELKIRKRMFYMITSYHNGLYYCIKTKYPSKYSKCGFIFP